MPNRLAAETSPYLLQHADNPVDWYPWGDEALELARREDKPVLLSVGYSACHWCHVMAHESFEDADTAALMNELFVNIKVDREERPDIDKIYQLAQQLLTHGAGGWPLTMFLAPSQTPFFGGTYFPKQPRHGLPAFKELLRRVAEYYLGHAAEIAAQGVQIRRTLESLEATADGRVVLNAEPLHKARAALEQGFDGEAGGFTRAPKFPHPGTIERCLRQWYATAAEPRPDLKALYMATLSLTRMAEGGIYDQVGGGFARYSVDNDWMIPHFEKMLYDNAQLLTEYARAALATGEPLFARIAGETADWVLRDMRSATRGFFSSLDADSQGHEGSFYVWTPAEVQALVPQSQYAVFARRFGLDRPANFEGAWHLRAVEPLATPDDQTLIDAARATLLRARNERISPGRDDKILTSWNALMIKGLAIAARVLARDELAEAAGDAVDFIRDTLWREGRLLATYKDGRAHLRAYLDDYAFLADALLELLQTRWRSSDLTFAIELIEVLLQRFEVPGGGFYFTASDHEELLHRSKTFSDDSLPSGNGIACSVLTRLGYLLGESRYLAAAERTLQAAWPALLEHPQAHMSMLDALEDTIDPPQLLIIRGTAERARDWARQLGALYAPRRMIFAIPSDASDLPPAIAEKRAGSATLAYLCQGSSCSAPVHAVSDLARQLKLRLVAAD